MPRKSTDHSHLGFSTRKHIARELRLQSFVVAADDHHQIRVEAG
jgi:hypothetical protein